MRDNGREPSGFELLVDILTLFAKYECFAADIVLLFGLEYLINLFNTVNSESLKKSILKLFRALVETGRKAFNSSNCLEVLTSLLENIIQQSDTNLTITSTANTIPSLLVAILRSSVAEADLPHKDQIKHRQFLPQLSQNDLDDGIVLNSDATALSLDDSQNIPEDLQDFNSKVNINANAMSENELSSWLSQAEEKHLEMLCSELFSGQESFIEKLNSNTEQPSNTQVAAKYLKSVCPVTPALGRGGVPLLLDRNPGDYRPSLKLPMMDVSPASSISPAATIARSSGLDRKSDRTYKYPTPKELEPLVRRSSNLMRKTVYEQTSRILQPGMYSDIVVYDIMDDKVAKAWQNAQDILQFESRFESGNLQMAIKVQQVEYDLLLQSDIGSKPGRHNQWFYFSVTNMIPGMMYKFNILNMSKGTSQFGEGLDEYLEFLELTTTPEIITQSLIVQSQMINPPLDV
ncbi:Cytosolic carboxypeptidase 1 [Entophlyctis sp. JEL0112]|nr:Cytosolic carboxypeptidase 1 [Entophlyctis sp. JEL0112]